ncbi:hypothetical protein RRG08_046846 [Elysia crispata]|uniref:Uncharacterized protein n=1 Tax=Elysia crispata TaxID=231223 RepID=A0AAE1DIW1_9GAST|nr:hypothetical protein RRG08_046846 [Elysia crispata]
MNVSQTDALQSLGFRQRSSQGNTRAVTHSQAFNTISPATRLTFSGGHWGQTAVTGMSHGLSDSLQFDDAENQPSSSKEIGGVMTVAESVDISSRTTATVSKADMPVT